MTNTLYLLGLTANLLASGYDLKDTQIPTTIYTAYTVGLITLHLLNTINLFTWATLTTILAALTTSLLLQHTGKWHTADTLTLTTAMISSPGTLQTKIPIILTTYLTTTLIIQEKTKYKEKYGGAPALPGITLGQTLLILLL